MQNLHELVKVPPEILMAGRLVMVGMPWYKSACPLTAFALLAMCDRTRMAFSIAFQDAFIVHSRNRIATEFVNSKTDYLFFIDDDMIPPMGDAAWFNKYTGMNLPAKFAGLHSINRLLSHNVPYVGATYFGRSPGGHAVFGEGKKLGELLKKHGPMDEIRPTRWVGTGCALFHKSVFLRIEEKFPRLSRAENGGIGQWFTSSEHNLYESSERVKEMLEDPANLTPAGALKMGNMLSEGLHKSDVNSRLGVGEDVIFSYRATEAGLPPKIDLGLFCGHVGSAVYPIRG